jgi:hypothetical protein
LGFIGLYFFDTFGAIVGAVIGAIIGYYYQEKKN